MYMHNLKTKIISLFCLLAPYVAIASSSLQNSIELCSSNSSEDCYFVGDAYFRGDGVQQNYKLAVTVQNP